MVHTADLTYFPDAQLVNTFRQLPNTEWWKQYKIWYNGTLKDNGLQFRFKEIVGLDFKSPRLYCRVNFSKLLHPDDKISLMTAWDIDAVENRFNELSKGLSSLLPEFQYWKANRIDYCVNVHTSYVEEYLNLMKKGDRRFMKDWYDKKNRNYTQKPGSLYLVSTAREIKNRGVTINFYNKWDERMNSYKDNDEIPYEKELIELPKDILRLEIQCHKPKTEYLKTKYGMPSKTVLHYLDPVIAHDIISHYLRIVAGKGDYHRKPVAMKMVDQTRCHKETKETLKKIIQDVAKQHSSISKVRDQYVCDGTMQREEYNHLIRTLRNHNINPVTVRKNKHLDGKTLEEGLDSVMSIFEDAFETEMTRDG